MVCSLLRGLWSVTWSVVCDVVRGPLHGPRSVLQTLWAAAVACV